MRRDFETIEMVLNTLSANFMIMILVHVFGKKCDTIDAFGTHVTYKSFMGKNYFIDYKNKTVDKPE